MFIKNSSMKNELNYDVHLNFFILITRKFFKELLYGKFLEIYHLIIPR
jgi:hypothetical protein